MKLILLSILLIAFLNGAFAQLTDDFADGDFTQNPIWTGDVSSFEINSSNYLHLKTTNSDTAILVTQSTVIQNTEWQFWVKQSFNSSSNNYSRVYLASNSADLKSSLMGYFVQIGSTADNISFWRQDGDILTELITGTNISTGNSVNNLSIKVICDASGNWELFAHDHNSNLFISEGTATDNTYSMGNYFGIFCKFTSSNSTKFYFDDFYVGNIIVDTIPPSIENIEVITSLNIDIKFDEVVDKNTSENTNNYVINNGIGIVAQAIRNSSDSSIVNLTLANALTYEQPYELSISNIKDLAGNTSPSSTHDIIWYNIKHGDIVINEIMCDPTPSVLLPAAEYIELYNNSPKSVNIDNWTLQIGSSIKTITEGSISPNSYVIIGHQDDEILLSSYGDFIGLSSFSLPNTNGSLLLKDKENNVLHYVAYSINWYNDNAKNDGGWSLEMIDANNYCGEKNNWAASKNLNGGTPGEQNSIADNNPDKEAPIVERIVVSSSKSLEVYFNESTDSVNAMDLSKYFVSEGIGNPITIKSSYPDYKSYTLEFSSDFIIEILYNLEISAGIKDCIGNTTPDKYVLKFGMPQKADSLDVLVNEVLFNPKNDGVDYVEIYNNSTKIINLKDLLLANWDNEDENWANTKEISETGFLIFPNEYYVLTTNKGIIKQQYYIAEPNNIVEMPSMPSMSDTEGNIFLINKSLQMIDGMQYDDNMHYALLNNPEGISLERLNISTSAIDKTNWHSAATPGRNAEGFGGTPTYENSQKSGIVSEGEWSNTPEIFSPDNDGMDDYLQINYKMKEPGYTANIVIYDAKGRLVRNLSSGEILGSEGQIIWDGLDNNNQKAKIGIYIILIDYYNPTGDAQAVKLTCVLGARF